MGEERCAPKGEEVMNMAGFPCEDCENYEYDEMTQEDVCVMDLDMDEFERLMLSPRPSCPYYRVRDEYRIVRRQN